MPQDQTLRYHAATLDLINEGPVFSDDAKTTLDQLERQRGFRLPASVREWYTLSDSVSILEKYSNEDYPTPLTDLGRTNRYWDKETARYYELDMVTTGYIPILVENQAVCTWAIDLTTGAEDPPVVLAEEAINPSTTWKPCTATFSEFIFTRVWDAKGMYFTRYWQMGDEEMPVTPDMLDFIGLRFAPGLTNRFFPEVRAHRFGRASQGMLLRELIVSDQELDGIVSAPRWQPWLGFHIWADSFDEMVPLLQMVRECPVLRDVTLLGPRIEPNVWKDDSND